MQRRRSQKREKVLDTLKRCHGALSAADLHKKMPEMDITTIYRNLELFVADGLVKKLNLGGEEALYEYGEEVHHHAVCSDCDKVIHFSASEEEIMKVLGLKDFDIDTVEVTVRGKCKH